MCASTASRSARIRPSSSFGREGIVEGSSISASSSASTASSALRPSTTTFRPLSGAGLWEAETMIPAAWRGSRLACTRQGVVTTPRSTASVPVEVSPAARAAESISPDRLVSRPRRTLRPDPPRRCPTARPSANASSASTTEPTGPRIPSVPKRPAIYGAGVGVGVGGGCGAWIVTGTVAGLIPTSSTPSGRPLTAGARSWLPGSRPEASTVGVRSRGRQRGQRLARAAQRDRDLVDAAAGRRCLRPRCRRRRRRMCGWRPMGRSWRSR